MTRLFNLPWLCTALLALLLGWSVTAWVLRWPTTTQPLPFEVVSPAAHEMVRTADASALARVLGAPAGVAPEAPAAQAVLALSGVVVPQVALIAVNGQAAKPVRLGQEVMPGWRLQSVHRQEAVLVSPQGGQQTLRLPARP